MTINFRSACRLCALLLLFSGSFVIPPKVNAQVISNGSGGDLVLAAGMHTIDTDSGEINALVNIGWDGLHFHLMSIDIQPGAIVTISGSQPLIFLATNDVTIDGMILGFGFNGADIGAEDLGGAVGGAGGSGGFVGGIGGGNPPFASNYFRSPGVRGDGPSGGDGGMAASSDAVILDYGSGAGGGHAAVGGDGGAAGSGIGGVGGSAVTSGFQGGSGGGGGSQEDDNSDVGIFDAADDGGAGGGGGGAAIRIVSNGSNTVPGIIDVAGGDGGDSTVSGAGGGGAGGRVELFSPIMPTVTGLIELSGGSGGTAPQMSTDGGAGATGTTRIEAYTPSVCSLGGPDLILGPGTFTINTDLGEIDGVPSPGFDGFVFNFNNVDIDPSATLNAIGTAPLVILANEDVVIAGIINAAGGDGDGGGGVRDGGARGQAGPGGFSGGRGGGVTPGTGIGDGEPGLGPGAGGGGLLPAVASGGGGGGHSVVGGSGITQGGTAGAGGAAYAIDLPLVGGSGGGGGTVHNAAPTGGGGGGGGGGAVRIISAGDLTVTGTIDAHGGGGGRGPGRAGGGGGGSGGTIDLQAAGALTTGAATLDVTGGVAGISGTGVAQGGAGADGRITTATSTCQTQVDLAISKINGVSFADPLDTLTYTITVSNQSGTDVLGAIVEDILPATLDALSASWSCTPSGSATCSASGSGDIVDTVDLPGFTDITYTLTIDVLATEDQVISNTATVSLPPIDLVDSDTSNNSATDSDPVGLLVDSFERLSDE